MRKIKKFLNLVWNEFIYGGHLLSLGAVSIVYTAAVLLDVNITWDFMVIVYLGSYAPYLYNRYKEFDKDILTNPTRTKHIERYIKYIPIIIFLCALIIIGIFLYFNKISTLLFALSLFLLGFVYTLLFKRLTKKVVGFKNIFVSLMWASLIIFLILYYLFPLNLAVFFLYLFVFFRLLIHEVLSDIKDIVSDQREKLRTIPIILHPRRLFHILLLLNILSGIPILVGVYLNLFPNYSVGLLLVILYTFYCLKGPKNNIIIDGEYVLWPLFSLLGKTIPW